MFVPHPVSISFSNGRESRGYTLVFKWLGHTRLHGRFLMSLTHPVTRSFSIGRDTLGYPLVFKLSRHIWLYNRFQKSWTSNSTFVFKRFGNTRVHTQFNTCFQMVGKHRLHTRFSMAGTHSVTRSFLNVQFTLGYTLVFK